MCYINSHLHLLPWNVTTPCPNWYYLAVLGFQVCCPLRHYQLLANPVLSEYYSNCSYVTPTTYIVWVCVCCQLNTIGVKTENERTKKPLTDNHPTDVNAGPALSAVCQSSAESDAVASDQNISMLSMVSVGPYEDFAVSIMFCVHYTSLFSVDVCFILVKFSM